MRPEQKLEQSVLRLKRVNGSEPQIAQNTIDHFRCVCLSPKEISRVAFDETEQAKSHRDKSYCVAHFDHGGGKSLNAATPQHTEVVHCGDEDNVFFRLAQTSCSTLHDTSEEFVARKMCSSYSRFTRTGYLADR